MKKLVSRITIALLVTLYACYPVHVMADEKDEGRYKGYDSATESGSHSIYILDSKTGEVRFCESYAGFDGIKGSCKILKVEK
tara:strand:- start:223 stop:468 length:246 start_codon:yes stop_codon:yes gene_type:complete